MFPWLQPLDCIAIYDDVIITSPRFHLVGLLLLFILDIGDIWLELSKSLIYFKVRDGKQYWGPELAANCTFAVFTIQQ